MTDHAAVKCPHCHEQTYIGLDTKKHAVEDVHPVRRTFDEIQDYETEKDYICDACEKQFYATLILIAPVDEIAQASHEALREKRWSFK